MDAPFHSCNNWFDVAISLINKPLNCESISSHHHNFYTLTVAINFEFCLSIFAITIARQSNRRTDKWTGLKEKLRYFEWLTYRLVLLTSDQQSGDAGSIPVSIVDIVLSPIFLCLFIQHNKAKFDGGNWARDWRMTPYDFQMQASIRTSVEEKGLVKEKAIFWRCRNGVKKEQFIACVRVTQTLHEVIKNCGKNKFILNEMKSSRKKKWGKRQANSGYKAGSRAKVLSNLEEKKKELMWTLSSFRPFHLQFQFPFLIINLCLLSNLFWGFMCVIYKIPDLRKDAPLLGIKILWSVVRKVLSNLNLNILTNSSSSVYLN
uniref:Uncharacterized protein n=1 Tax=Glossina austeni TaxID=7395 RepID=A0A1A9UE47_GLOAU